MDELAAQMARENALTNLLREEPREEAESLADALHIAEKRLFRPLLVSEEKQIADAYFSLQEELHTKQRLDDLEGLKQKVMEGDK